MSKQALKVKDDLIIGYNMKISLAEKVKLNRKIQYLKRTTHQLSKKLTLS